MKPYLNVQQNVGINQPWAVDDNRGLEGLVPPQRQPIAPKGRAQHPSHMMYEEDDVDLDGAGDDVDLDGAGATGAIVLPALPPSVKFTITSTFE
ncbi:hypothetical protein KY285_012945 [Solanum tuberosum]|nr:hypothetical protein KY285_012945 [Solanum tuberosum]